MYVGPQTFLDYLQGCVSVTECDVRSLQDLPEDLSPRGVLFIKEP